MKFVLAANHRFKSWVDRCTASLDRLKADYTVYDLGSLGTGTPWLIKNDTFQSMGYYRSNYIHHACKGMHKPGVLINFLHRQEPGQLVCLIDADTVVLDPMAELEKQVIDVALTVNAPERFEQLGEYFYLNAGVMFVRRTEPALRFLDRWRERAKADQNEQLALFNMLKDAEGESVLELPVSIYNYRQVTDQPIPPTAKIVHYIASLRDPVMRRLWSMRGVDRPLPAPP